MIKSGVQTVFTVDQLTGNYAARIAASTKYQISLVFPRKIQSIGVNAAKQGDVMATIDQYDGRVVYIDALTSGGAATLNFRMLTEADVYTEKTGQDVTGDEFAGTPVKPGHDPIILKMIVYLTDKDSSVGVLSYKVTPGVVEAQAQAPVQAPVQPQTPPKPVVKVEVAPPPLPKATVFTGVNANLNLNVNVSAQAATADKQEYTYEVKVTPKEGKSYFLDTSQTLFKVKNISVPTALTTARVQTPVTAQTPATGSFSIAKKVLDQNAPRVLMFTVIERENVSGATKRLYIGVLLK